MRWCAEMADGTVVEVTNLFNQYGEVYELPEALACVVKFNDGHTANYPVDILSIHTVH